MSSIQNNQNNQIHWDCFYTHPWSTPKGKTVNIVLWCELYSQRFSLTNPFCGVMGCPSCGPGQTHYCNICKVVGCDHRAKSHYTRNGTVCLTRNPNCGVVGCISCRPGQTHYCWICGGNDHRAISHFK